MLAGALALLTDHHRISRDHWTAAIPLHRPCPEHSRRQPLAAPPNQRLPTLNLTTRAVAGTESESTTRSTWPSLTATPTARHLHLGERRARRHHGLGNLASTMFKSMNLPTIAQSFRAISMLLKPRSLPLRSRRLSASMPLAMLAISTPIRSLMLQICASLQPTTYRQVRVCRPACLRHLPSLRAK